MTIVFEHYDPVAGLWRAGEPVPPVLSLHTLEARSNTGVITARVNQPVQLIDLGPNFCSLGHGIAQRLWGVTDGDGDPVAVTGIGSGPWSYTPTEPDPHRVTLRRVCTGGVVSPLFSRTDLVAASSTRLPSDPDASPALVALHDLLWAMTERSTAKFAPSSLMVDFDSEFLSLSISRQATLDSYVAPKHTAAISYSVDGGARRSQPELVAHARAHAKAGGIVILSAGLYNPQYDVPPDFDAATADRNEYADLVQVLTVGTTANANFRRYLKWVADKWLLPLQSDGSACCLRTLYEQNNSFWWHCQNPGYPDSRNSVGNRWPLGATGPNNTTFTYARRKAVWRHAVEYLRSLGCHNFLAWDSGHLGWPQNGNPRYVNGAFDESQRVGSAILMMPDDDVFDGTGGSNYTPDQSIATKASRSRDLITRWPHKLFGLCEMGRSQSGSGTPVDMNQLHTLLAQCPQLTSAVFWYSPKNAGVNTGHAHHIIHQLNAADFMRSSVVLKREDTGLAH